MSLPTAKTYHPSKVARAVRFLSSVFDPRAWLHMLKLVNYYNSTHVAPRRRATIGPGARISPACAFSYGERIFIGARANLGARSMLWAGPARGTIRIGDDVMLAPDVFITAASYRYQDGAPISEQIMDEADVVIGTDVWVGAKAVLLPGTTLGDGVIVAAGAVVRGSVPDFAIVAGVPARIVSQRDKP